MMTEEPSSALTGAAVIVQRKRNFAPKVKTGCILCKTRKVKCDEGKPSCKRCLDRKHTCAYIIPKARIFESTSTRTRPRPPSPLPQIHPLTVRYGSSHEASCLAFFVKRTGPMLSMSSCEKDFWSVFVPQASWVFPAVKHMLVALSLLDQYLSSPMWALIPDAEYVLALRSYNKAIKEVTRGDQPMSCILLTSVLAWMFEGISNRPEVANIHIEAALKIAAELREGRMQAISVQERDIVNTIEGASLGDSYTFLELWAPDEGRDPPDPFETLDEARGCLSTVIQTIKLHHPVRTDLALSDLRRWRLAFEAYRYKGIEPLAPKRQVFLHHNILITRIALQHFSSLSRPKNRRILADIEALFATEDAMELRDGLSLLLNFLAEDKDSEDRAQVEVLQRKLERLW